MSRIPAAPEIHRQALATLAELWSLSPDVRLGQLLTHLGFLGEAHLDKGLGGIEDDELMAVMHRHRAELLARLQSASNPARRSREIQRCRKPCPTHKLSGPGRPIGCESEGKPQRRPGSAAARG